MRTVTITVGRVRLNPKLARFFASHFRKVRYGHAQTAENACRRMEAKGIPGLTKYKCEFCDGWHIGH